MPVRGFFLTLCLSLSLSLSLSPPSIPAAHMPDQAGGGVRAALGGGALEGSGPGEEQGGGGLPPGAGLHPGRPAGAAQARGGVPQPGIPPPHPLHLEELMTRTHTEPHVSQSHSWLLQFHKDLLKILPRSS